MAKKKNKANMEQAVESAPEATAPVQASAQAPVMTFDAWFALRSGLIPPQHHKEIIKADFDARKVKYMSTLSEFDEALKKYGVKL